MALPPSFLQHVEQHPCFTGCYSSTSAVRACLDPNNPLVPLVVVSCQDCYAHLGVPQTVSQDLHASPHIGAGAESGWLKLTLAGFLPRSAAASGGSGKPVAKPAAPKVLKLGDVCPVCGAVVRERPLLNGSFVGCMC